MNQGKEVPEDVLTYIIKASEEVTGDDREKMHVMMDEFTLFFIAGKFLLILLTLFLIAGKFLLIHLNISKIKRTYKIGTNCAKL